MKAAAFGLARWTGVVAIARWMERRHIPVLCYHSVVPSPVPAGFAHGGLHLPLAEFQWQMQYLARHYRVVSLRDVATWLDGGGAPPDGPAVAVTFDDGYANNVTCAAPVLRAHGMRATAFLATGYLDTGGLYWWDEVEFLIAGAVRRRAPAPAPWGEVDLESPFGVQRVRGTAASALAAVGLVERRGMLDALAVALDVPADAVMGRASDLHIGTWDAWHAATDVFDLGGHSAEHRLLDRIDVSEVHHELAACAAALDRRSGGGERGRPFCYPAGKSSSTVVRAVRDAGFGCAVGASGETRDHRPARRGDSVWEIPRIGVPAGMSRARFAAALTSLPSRLAGWRHH